MTVVKIEKHPNLVENHGWYIPIPPEIIEKLDWNTWGTTLAMKIEDGKLTVEKHDEI